MIARIETAVNREGRCPERASAAASEDIDVPTIARVGLLRPRWAGKGAGPQLRRLESRCCGDDREVLGSVIGYEDYQGQAYRYETPNSGLRVRKPP